MNADAFRAAMAALPPPPPASPPHWPFWQSDMQAQAATCHPDTFWDWPATRHTMLVAHFPMGEQLAYLKTDWPRWERALSNLENDHHYRNMINQAYCLKMWEDATGQRIEQLDSVYEFGGGYGAMAHLGARLGFRGRYLIYDLPEFALLQKYFLGKHGIEVEHVSEPESADLFVALYSLSETSMDFRANWAEHIDARSYAMLFSEKWGTNGSLDNRAFFEKFVSQRNHLTWAFPRYLQRPDYFALGWRA